MATKVKAAVLEAPQRVRVQEFDRPAVGKDAALLRVEMVGICGTDVHFFRGEIEGMQTPMVLGHEILGHIEEIGDEAAKRWGVRAGDRVVVEGLMSCGVCANCKDGAYQYCEATMSFGTRFPTSKPPALWGAFSQYMYMPIQANVHRISSGIPAEAAVQTCALIANGIEWVQITAGVKKGDTVVILGPGPQGVSCTVAAREAGASRVIVTGLSRDVQRLAMAREFGAHYTIDVEKEDVEARVKEITGGKLADALIEVSGSPKAVRQSLSLVRPRATIVVAGHHGKDVLTPLPIDVISLKGLKLVGVRGKAGKATAAAVKLVESRKYPWERLISHRYPLEETEEAIRATAGEIPGVYPTKAAIVPW